MFAGLLIGLFVAFLVYIKMQSGVQPPQVFLKESLPAKETVTETGTPDREDATDAKPSEPRFDFYTLLPEMEVVVPE